jgi:hypothetical protein
MKYHLLSALLVALLAGLLFCSKPAEGQVPDVPNNLPPGTDIQARGPVHEAYAEPTNVVGAPGAVAAREPPTAIEEAPPEEKPAGDNVVWIPGYWSWDEEGKDFLWVSGFWRAVPPGRAWTPGHWQKVPAGFQWVSGYWAKPNVVETEYLPPPPATLDNGPSVPAPAATSTYVPGCWIYQVNRYVWRPGYWVAFRVGWVWTPSCYRWTPGGYIYVAGYWDVPLLERGLLFAPVRFTRPVYLERTYVYRPTFVVQPDFLCGALFIRPGLPCFYFGNYFAPRYRKTYVSWVDYRVNRTVIDVNYSYYRAAYVKHPDWDRNLRTLYVSRAAGTIPRPPLTLRAQTRVVNNITINKTTNVVVNKNINITNIQNVSVLQPVKRINTVQVTAMASLATSKPGPVAAAPIRRDVRVERVTKERIVEERRGAARIQAIASERRAAETTVIKRPPVVGAAPVKVKVTLPAGTPPARVIRTPVKPPPPHPRLDSKTRLPEKRP